MVLPSKLRLRDLDVSLLINSKAYFTLSVSDISKAGQIQSLQEGRIVEQSELGWALEALNDIHGRDCPRKDQAYGEGLIRSA
jgi:hypothetical protein